MQTLRPKKRQSLQQLPIFFLKRGSRESCLLHQRWTEGKSTLSWLHWLAVIPSFREQSLYSREWWVLSFPTMYVTGCCLFSNYLHCGNTHVHLSPHHMYVTTLYHVPCMRLLNTSMTRVPCKATDIFSSVYLFGGNNKMFNVTHYWCFY